MVAFRNLMLRDRTIVIRTPLPPETLRFEHMSGREALGQPFFYDTYVLSKDPDLDLDQLLGRAVSIHVELPVPLGWRFFDGYVTSARYLGHAGEHYRYQLTLEPWLALLRATTRTRVYQNKTVPSLVDEIIREHGFSVDMSRLSPPYTEREYIVQYGETTFDFLSRLLEEEGIYYFFEHEAGRHTLVLADSIAAHLKATGYEVVPFYPPQAGARREREHFLNWEEGKLVVPGAYATSDRNYELRDAHLRARLELPKSHPHAALEVYEVPGHFSSRAEGERRSAIRLEELQAGHHVAEASGNTRGIGVGHTFRLTNHPREAQNVEHLVVRARYELAGTALSSGSNEAEQDFSCTFATIPIATPFRPRRTRPRPRVMGPETATVVGPKQEEIWTDQYGRVRVQFHWDREGANDENSSCWVRVAQPWAGAGWGTVFIPRIGQEVVVEFIGGDPDQPLVTAAVYNAANKPPYLPGNPTQSGIRSRSTKGGGIENFNELRFEDKKGEEQVYLQAEKDLRALVKHDETREIGHDRVTEIGNDETVKIAGHRTEAVAKNETITIDGSRTEKVAKDETIEVNGVRTETVAKDETIAVKGKRSTTVSKDESLRVNANRTVEVAKDESLSTGGARTVKVAKDDALSVDGDRSQIVKGTDGLKVSKSLVVDVGDEITIKAGAASITLKKDGSVVIKGKDIAIEGSGKISAKASGDVVLKGTKITQN